MTKRISLSEWDELKAHSRHNLTDPLWLGGGHCIHRLDVSDRPQLHRTWADAAPSARYIAAGDALTTSP